MILLAIDPGVEKVGYSVFDKKKELRSFKYVTSGLIKTSRKLTQGKRLQEIYEMLLSVLAQYKAEHIVMEQLFFAKNVKTAISVAQAQGVIELLSAKQNIPLSYLTPNEIKATITGYGNADKKAIKKMIDLTLSEKIDILDDDQSDAIACGLAYCYLTESLS